MIVPDHGKGQFGHHYGLPRFHIFILELWKSLGLSALWGADNYESSLKHRGHWQGTIEKDFIGSSKCGGVAAGRFLNAGREEGSFPILTGCEKRESSAYT